MFVERTVGRLGEEVSDRYEMQALGLMVNKFPECIPLGLGLGMYTYYISDLSADHASGEGIEPIDSGWIVLLLDVGICGILGIAFAISSSCRAALLISRKATRSTSMHLRALAGSLVACSALHFGTGALIPIMIWLGITNAYSRVTTTALLARSQ